MPPDSQDEVARAREPPDLLRGQMREWMDRVVAAGRTGDLFELEMWLRSFERFFRIKNQPLSEKETRAARPPELVRGAAPRRQRRSCAWSSFCTAILSEDQVNLTRTSTSTSRATSGRTTWSTPTSRSWCARPRRSGPHPAPGVLRGHPRRPHGPDAALADPIRDLHGGGEGPLPRGPAEPPPGPAHRQEVQADPRPDHEPRPSPSRSASIRGTRGSASRPPGSSSSSSGCSTTLSTPTPQRVDEEDLKNTILIFSPHHLRDPAASQPTWSGVSCTGLRPELRPPPAATTRSCTACPWS